MQMRTDGLWQIDTKYPTHLAFPLAKAEALIDPNDVTVRDLVYDAIDANVRPPGVSYGNGCACSVGAIYDAVLAALRGAK